MKKFISSKKLNIIMTLVVIICIISVSIVPVSATCVTGKQNYSDRDIISILYLYTKSCFGISTVLEDGGKSIQIEGYNFYDWLSNGDFTEYHADDDDLSPQLVWTPNEQLQLRNSLFDSVADLSGNDIKIINKYGSDITLDTDGLYDYGARKPIHLEDNQNYLDIDLDKDGGLALQILTDIYIEQTPNLGASSVNNEFVSDLSIDGHTCFINGENNSFIPVVHGAAGYNTQICCNQRFGLTGDEKFIYIDSDGTKHSIHLLYTPVPYSVGGASDSRFKSYGFADSDLSYSVDLVNDTLYSEGDIVDGVFSTTVINHIKTAWIYNWEYGATDSSGLSASKYYLGLYPTLTLEQIKEFYQFYLVVSDDRQVCFAWYCPYKIWEPTVGTGSVDAPYGCDLGFNSYSICSRYASTNSNIHYPASSISTSYSNIAQGTGQIPNTKSVSRAPALIHEYMTNSPTKNYDMFGYLGYVHLNSDRKIQEYCFCIPIGDYDDSNISTDIDGTPAELVDGSIDTSGLLKPPSIEDDVANIVNNVDDQSIDEILRNGTFIAGLQLISDLFSSIFMLPYLYLIVMFSLTIGTIIFFIGRSGGN